jgi:hypothetical protein
MKSAFQGLAITVLCALFFLFAPARQYAQQPGPPENGAAEGIPELSPEQRRIEMEINTSTLPELAVWCRSLGLSEGGTKPDLIQRLRNHFKLPSVSGETEDTRKIITIESARSTQYFKLETVNEEYARLTGEVRVSLKDGDAVHRITAWEILFNRTRNTLTASGGVEYVNEQDGTVETFRGESITVNLDNWSSIFLNGVSERSVQNNDTSYRFAGSVISRNDQEVTVLNKASISNAKNPEALWSIEASRVWLLPGSDFAIFNALLKVGEIPVLYIPFFYYPADEVIFHPVIGNRSREGNFVQTTTYILGRPKASSASQSSLTRILGNSDDVEKKREGIFLRSTGKKVTSPDSVSLKAMVDYYTNLGAYVGTELTTVKQGILNPINLTLGLGFTRTVIGPPNTGNYTPFFPAYDGTSHWNSSNLFSAEVPFRYRFRTASSLSGRYGSFSWNFPYYSDPWVDYDFTRRTETMDWVNIVQQGASFQEETSAENQLGAYQWQLTGSLNPSLSKLSPYISNMSISGFTSTMAFRQIQTDTSKIAVNDPGKFPPNTIFFAPDRFTIYSITGSISGTPLTLGAASPSRSTGAAQSAPPVDDPFKNIGVPRSPWEKGAAGEQSKGPADRLAPPVLNQRFDLPTRGGPRFSIDYRIAPTSSSELQFRSSEWKQPGDINWNEIASILSTFGGDASTTFNLNHSSGLFSNAFVFSGNGAWRQYGYINEDAQQYTPTAANPNPVREARKQQYSQSFFSTTYGYTGTIRPLYWSSVWGQSNLQYNFRGLAVRSKFDTASTGDDPKWDIEYGEWVKEKLDTHQLSANIAASVMDKTQNLGLTADLPPRDTALSGNATFRVWVTETNARMRVFKPGEDQQKLEQFYATETIRFGTPGSLVQYLVLDTEKKELETLTTTLSLWGLRAEYTASRMTGYELLPATGWRPLTGDPSLKSRDFTLSYIQNFAQKELIKDRFNFSLNVNSRLFLDLQRYTNSSFNQSLGFTVGINGFLDLSLAATSENAVIYRYLQDIPFFELPVDYPGEKNILQDLAHSFRFDRDDLRRQSGFKLKNFRLSATHHLGDWNATLNIIMSPYLDQTITPYRYNMNSEIAFLVQWIPVGEIKTDIKYDKQTDKWVIE